MLGSIIAAGGRNICKYVFPRPVLFSYRFSTFVSVFKWWICSSVEELWYPSSPAQHLVFADHLLQALAEFSILFWAKMPDVSKPLLETDSTWNPVFTDVSFVFCVHVPFRAHQTIQWQVSWNFRINMVPHNSYLIFAIYVCVCLCVHFAQVAAPHLHRTHPSAFRKRKRVLCAAAGRCRSWWFLAGWIRSFTILTS